MLRKAEKLFDIFLTVIAIIFGLVLLSIGLTYFFTQG